MSSNPDFEDELLKLLPALHQFARTMCRQSTDVDDLVQETVVKALKNQDKYVPFGPLKSWLFTIMKNTFCSKIKRARREDVMQEWDGPTIGPSQDWAMELQDVGRAYDRLSPLHRNVIELVIFNGLSYEHAATKAGCTIGTIKSRLNRARTQLEGDLSSAGKH
ncbi:sigma-70 family RNA polymerase sigma factor [Ochrobactrum soli]|uniref:sigma-70 family RNA polymerase sigma factor n=1 Tax=Ochrobactrum soli TaxID=2448455 RepID=UPI000EF21138|nr:sigma-70 family RNA polymerase sigma factor [[Ochrobactrum] soli]RLL72076.1 sigma-70 family RNA polymerase sigma factor [[Ochrobactrum] soli]